MRKREREEISTDLKYLPFVKNKKRTTQIKFIGASFMIAFIVVLIFFSDDSIKDDVYKFVIFIRNIIVHIISKEFPDFSAIIF